MSARDSAMPPDGLRLLRDSFPDRPALGTAVSRAILGRVASGELPPTIRLHRPGRELAFSRQDRLAAGFERAVAVARGLGFEPVLRLAGGRAAAFHEGTLALARAWPTADPARTTRDRFGGVSAIIAAALRGLGVDAHVGEVPGEYCPGAWSVNTRGKRKLAGIGQRLIGGGAHVGAVIVVTGSELLRAILEPVYEALELDWDPATVGAVEDEVAGVTLDDVEAAIVAELSRSCELELATLDEETLAAAQQFAAQHRVD